MYLSCMSFLTTPTSEAAVHWDARLWGALVVLCGVLFLDGLDVSMVGVALPSIRSDLDLSTSSLQWLVSGYVLGYGGLLLLGGRFADLLGRRRVLIGALAVFTARLDPRRAGQRRHAARSRPASSRARPPRSPRRPSLSIITTTFEEGPARNRALSIYTACGASGFSLGLVFGGLMTEIGWRWTFLLPVPIAIALLVAAPRVLAKDPPVAAGVRRSFDFAGAVTLTAAMLLLVRTVVEAPETGWGAPETLVGLRRRGAAAGRVRRRSSSAPPHPLVRLGILRSGALVRANLGMMTRVRRLRRLPVRRHAVPAVAARLVAARDRAGVPAGRPDRGVRLPAARSARRPLRHRRGSSLAASIAFAAGYALFLRLGESSRYVGLFLPTMLLLGVGFALSFPALNMQATNGIADHEQGLASGLVNTSFQVGGAIGLAIVTRGGDREHRRRDGHGLLLDGFRPAIAVVTGVGVHRAGRRPRGHGPGADAPA